MAIYAFSDESGSFRANPCFLVGMIITSDPHSIEQEIENLRVENRYRGREFKYQKNDKLKIPLCKAAIDFFVRSDAMDFRCIVKSMVHHDLSYYTKSRGPSWGMSPEDLAYNHTYSQVLRNNLRDWFTLILDRRTLARRNNLYSYLISQVDFLEDIQPRDSKAFNLLQLADLLTGCVYGDCTGIENPVKREIIDHLKAALRVTRLTVSTPLRLRNKFNVWHWSPP